MDEQAADAKATVGVRVPGQVLTCGWCSGPVVVKSRGRIPRWCSPTCRHRAWEQSRAAASGAVAVEVIDRVVQRVVEKRVEVERRVEVPAPLRGPGWAAAITELTRQVDTGRLYDRDLPALAQAVVDLNQALQRRLTRTNRW